jgi:hypothetical protein
MNCHTCNNAQYIMIKDYVWIRPDHATQLMKDAHPHYESLIACPHCSVGYIHAKENVRP